MKTILSLFASVALGAAAYASAGPGPWANATYFPGNLDGKYQAAVYGNNISGVLGFALANGSPTISTNSTLNLTNGSSQSTVVMDPFQNYFAIFVEGRTYTGGTIANINYDNSTVTGALIGTQPNFTGTAVPLDYLNRGLNGGFRADITGNGGIFTFVGDGELSTPAQIQTIRTNANPDGSITAWVETATVPFQLNGIRVSFLTAP